MGFFIKKTEMKEFLFSFIPVFLLHTVFLLHNVSFFMWSHQRPDPRFSFLLINRIFLTDLGYFTSDIICLVLKICSSQPDALCDLIHICFL